MDQNLQPLIFSLLCGGFFALILGALGVFLIVFNLRSKKKAQASLSWSSTSGKVTKAEVKQGQGVEDEDGYSRTIYYPAVEYEYQPGEQVFTGQKISFGGKRTYVSKAKAAADLSQFPVGGQVPVYYNPAKPEEAVLERKAKNHRRVWS